MTKHQGFTVWFTGLPCCGKTTVADRVATILKEKGYRVERLDGDIVREGLTNDLGFSRKDRDENIRRIVFVAKMLSRNNVIVLATFVSPYREARRDARREIGRFVEVYVRCPVEICMKRDVKGMYKKAREEKITHFTGVDDPYEEPEHPELILDTDKESVDESIEKVLLTLVKLQYIS
jgi:adenylylsulfate kinase